MNTPLVWECDNSNRLSQGVGQVDDEAEYPVVAAGTRHPYLICVKSSFLDRNQITERSLSLLRVICGNFVQRNQKTKYRDPSLTNKPKPFGTLPV
jgi:hypothetical protein